MIEGCAWKSTLPRYYGAGEAEIEEEFVKMAKPLGRSVKFG